MTQLRTVVRPAAVPVQRSRPEAEALREPPSLLRVRARRRGRPVGVVVVVLAVALALALGLAAHLWVVSDAWRVRAQSAEAQQARAQGASELLQQRLVALQSDLDASDARVEQLAAEKARATDLREARTR